VTAYGSIVSGSIVSNHFLQQASGCHYPVLKRFDKLLLNMLSYGFLTSTFLSAI